MFQRRMFSLEAAKRWSELCGLKVRWLIGAVSHAV